MIKVGGSTHRSFEFPADLATTFAYYSDLQYILNFLPKVYITRHFADDKFRVCYQSTELNVYDIQIFCDLEADLDGTVPVLRLNPLHEYNPVRKKSGFRNSVAQGIFQSESVFKVENGKTIVDYRLNLSAKLDTPSGLRLMPGSVVEGIASNITNWRIKEIADGFIIRSINAFPDWLSEMSQPGKYHAK